MISEIIVIKIPPAPTSLTHRGTATVSQYITKYTIATGVMLVMVIRDVILPMDL